MSEQASEALDFNQFLADSAAMHQFRAAIERQFTAYSWEFSRLLDDAGAGSIWHPDQDESLARAEAAIEAALEGRDSPPTELDAYETNVNIALQRQAEQGVMARGARLRTRMMLGQDITGIMDDKKRILAELKYYQYPPAWANAIDATIGGDPLDLADPQDRAIYNEVASSLTNPAPDPVADRIGDITRAALDGNTDPARSVRLGALGSHLIYVIKLSHLHPDQQANAEAAIQEGITAGLLSAATAALLRPLIYDPPADPAAN